MAESREGKIDLGPMQIHQLKSPGGGMKHIQREATIVASRLVRDLAERVMTHQICRGELRIKIEVEHVEDPAQVGPAP